jgi:flagellar FliL protein
VAKVKAARKAAKQKRHPAASNPLTCTWTIIANYGAEAGRLRFVKVDITLRVELGGENPVVHHMPALRHELVMLISRQTPESIASMEGKELMRQEALEAVRNVLVAEEGDQKIADLLFNSFVVQR